MSLIHGDCIEVMAELAPGVCDAVVTDPPAGIAFMGKTWDRDKGGRSQWVAWMTAVMSECLRVLKPGGWLVCWSLPRTSHWTAWAIEDAGFRLTDVLLHVFASGFPKGRSQMKPAYEPWILARKPGPLRELAIDRCRIAATPEDVAVQRARTGGEMGAPTGNVILGPGTRSAAGNDLGRWPSNVVLTSPIFDGDTPGVVGGGWQSGGGNPAWRSAEALNRSYGGGLGAGGDQVTGLEPVDTEGSYSRFFLIPKSARSEREPVLGGLPPVAQDFLHGGLSDPRMDRPQIRKPRINSHPTVKSLDLMRHLVRLVTPTGGTVLDPFAGSGTTLLAAELEGFPWIGIEREAEYVAIIEARLNGTQRGLGLPA